MLRTSDQMHRRIEVPDHPQRIISLVPSQTELLHDLGLGERVVGITKFCIHPEEWFRSKPRVGGTKTVDIKKVRELKPDLIIGNKEENERWDIEALEKEFPVWMSDVRNLPTALDMITRLGELTRTGDKAYALARAINAAFDDLAVRDASRSAAYFIWQDPFMVASADTFVNDLLQRAGLTNAFADLPGRYPEISAEQLAAKDPDIILLSSEPYPFAEKHIATFNMLCPGTPVLLVDGTYFSWYGSRLLNTPDYLSGLPII